VRVVEPHGSFVDDRFARIVHFVRNCTRRFADVKGMQVRVVQPIAAWIA